MDSIFKTPYITDLPIKCNMAIILVKGVAQLCHKINYKHNSHLNMPEIQAIRMSSKKNNNMNEENK